MSFRLPIVRIIYQKDRLLTTFSGLCTMPANIEMAGAMNQHPPTVAPPAKTGDARQLYRNYSPRSRR